MAPKRTLVALAWVLLLAASAAGGEKKVPEQEDPERRFHEAYVREVVEGKIAEAAKIYLDLMSGAGVPSRLRAEARFRFAVCAVLLGRADEARAHFAALLADPAAAPALKARVKEYSRAVEGIGLGTELEKKLESLVFELGRVDPVNPPRDPPPVYRDFEIIGPRAVPFLRKLLAHPDLALRRHAFRILVRMNAEGIADAWTPEIGVWPGLALSLSRWAKTHPAGMLRFEKRFLALPDRQLARWVRPLRAFPRLSESFVRAVADRFGAQAVPLWEAIVPRARGEAVLFDWIRDGPEARAVSAARILIQVLGLRDPEYDLPPADLFPLALQRVLSGGVIRSKPPYSSSLAHPGLRRWAAALTTGQVLEALESLLERARAWKGEVAVNPVLSGLAEDVASGLDGRLGKEAVRDRYAKDLLEWVEGMDGVLRGMGQAARRSGPLPDSFLARLERCLALLPEAAAQELATRIFGAEGRGNLPRYVGLFRHPGALPFPVLLAAWRAAPCSVATLLTRHVPGFGDLSRSVSAEEARRVLAALPEILDKGAYYRSMSLSDGVTRLLVALPQGEAPEALYRLCARSEEVRTSKDMLVRLLRVNPALIAPILPRIYRLLAPGEVKMALLATALATAVGDATRPGVREPIVGFVKSVLRDLPANYWGPVLAHPEIFPPEEWVPVAPPDYAKWFTQEYIRRKYRSPLADRAARALVERGSITRSVLLFIDRAATPEVGRELTERLYTRPGTPLLLVHQVLGHLASPETIEGALDRTLAGKEPDPVLVVALAETLVKEKPTAKLLAAAKLLLAAKERDLAAPGIRIAQALGREDLLPALAAQLDSLDPAIRGAAKQAMDAILELKRLRKEAKERYGSGGTKGK